MHDLVPADILAPPDGRNFRRHDAALVLDRYLRRLARQEARCRIVLGQLARAFLRHRGQHALGFARLGDYSRERLGLSARELQNLASVMERLADLPAIAAAFEQSEVSWAQLRLLVGVAEPETEHHWLARARGRTVRALAAQIGRPEDPEPDDGEPRAHFHFRCPRRVARDWQEAVVLARRMAGSELTQWQAAEAVAAEAWSAVPSWGGADRWLYERARQDTESRDPNENLDAFAPDLDWSAVEEAIPEDVAHLGVDVERLDAFVLAFGDAYRAGDLSWARALALLPVLSETTAAAWIARAQAVTVRRLGDEVEWALAGQASRLPPPPDAAVDDRQMCAGGDDDVLDAEIRFTAPVSVVALLRTLSVAFGGHGEPLWKGFERLLAHVRAEWVGQPRHRDPVFARDGWRCAVPACSARRSLHDHHLVFRSRGGTNLRANRITLCAWHHLRGIHEGRIRAWGRAPHDLHWELGVRPGHAPLLHLDGERYVTAGPSPAHSMRSSA